MIIRMKDGAAFVTKLGSNIVFGKQEYTISFITDSGVILSQPIKNVLQIEPK